MTEQEKCPKCGAAIKSWQLQDGMCNPCHYCDGTGKEKARACDMCEGSGRLHPVSLETVQKAFANLAPPQPQRCDICGESDLLDHSDDRGLEVCRDSLRRQLEQVNVRAGKAEAACAAMMQQVRSWNENVETIIGKQPETGIDMPTLGRSLLDRLAAQDKLIAALLPVFERQTDIEIVPTPESPDFPFRVRTDCRKFTDQWTAAEQAIAVYQASKETP